MDKHARTDIVDLYSITVHAHSHTHPHTHIQKHTQNKKTGQRYYRTIEQTRIMDVHSNHTSRQSNINTKINTQVKYIRTGT